MSRPVRFALAAAVVLLAVAALVRMGDRPVRTVGGPVAVVAPRDPAAGPFDYADVRRAKAVPPARFAAPLPRVAEFERLGAEPFPPRAHVRDLLCAGDDDMWRRLREAIAGSDGATVADVSRTYGELLRFCHGDGCFAARYVAPREPATVAFPAWRVLVSCPRREADALFRRPDAPAAALLARADEASWNARLAPPDADRVVAAALEVIAATSGVERRVAAFGLASAGRKGAEALLALHAKEKDPERRHDLAMALSRVDDPRARAALRAACGSKPDPACTRGDAGVPGKSDRAVPGAPPPAALVSRLRALGLLPDAPLPAADVAGADRADALLLAAGRAAGFDVETGMFPNEHDSLLRDLAALAPGVLAEARFDEVPPPEDDEQRAYLVRAWAFGRRWEVRAQNLGDWYDVGACVGLLNTIARECNLDVRWLVLETGDQTAIVVAGPEAGIRTAIAEGLLRPAGASDAMDAGKAFERKALEQLQRGPR